MKTLISIGDFLDIYFKLRALGFSAILQRLTPSNSKNRIKKSWDLASSKSASNWWSVPLIQKRWNKIISGDENIEYPEYLVKKYLNEKNNLILLSPGCGSGSKELKFARFNNFKLIEAFDLSPKRIALAKDNLKNRGIKNVSFTVSDIMSFNFESNKYDVVLFDSSLHHVKELNFVLTQVYGCLKDDGILVINEYIGPSRFQWSNEQLKASDNALKILPDSYKKRWQNEKVKSKNYRPGILRMIIADPSESVRSENIQDEIYNRFNVLEEKPYGGNILHLALKDISQNFIDENEQTINYLNRLFEIEDNFLAEGNKSDFMFGVYSKKQLN